MGRRLRRAEASVLWALKTLPPEKAYGLRVADLTGMPFGAWAILLRLRERGWVTSTVELQEPDDPGPPRVLYRLTPAGRMAAAGVHLEDCAYHGLWWGIRRKRARRGGP